MKGLIGKKLGMTSIYDDKGAAVPVTVLEVGPCVVVQRKEEDRDGYSAVQLGYAEQKEQRVNKAAKGHFNKAGVATQRILREFRVDADTEVAVGDVLNASAFEEVNYVDVVATGKGRGFQGVVKRYDFGGGRASHGEAGCVAQVRSVCANFLDVYSRVRRCPDTWEISGSLHKTCK